jgi:hypothetical protein
VSDFLWDDGRATERAEDANARDEWDAHLDLWRQTRDDALNRDRGESGNPAYATHTERVRDAGYEAHDPKGASVR